MDYKDYTAGANEDNFYFKGKNNLLEKILQKNFYNLSSQKILVVGCGTGEELGVLNKYGECHILDNNSAVFDLIHENAYKKKYIGDACALPFQRDTFDLVVALDVLEHIKNHQIAIKEIFRVLRKGGHFIFSVPAYTFLYSAHDKALMHHRRYNINDIKTLIRGFTTNLFYWNSILFLPIALLRILKKKSMGVDNLTLPKALNFILTRTLLLENLLIIKGFKFPFGLSIVGVCRKN